TTIRALPGATWTPADDVSLSTTCNLVESKFRYTAAPSISWLPASTTACTANVLPTATALDGGWMLSAGLCDDPVAVGVCVRVLVIATVGAIPVAVADGTVAVLVAVRVGVLGGVAIGCVAVAVLVQTALEEGVLVNVGLEPPAVKNEATIGSPKP